MEQEEYDLSKVIRVEMSKVHPNTWNPKKKQHEKVATIERSIKKIGFKQPIQVRNHPTIEGEYEIIDGEQRWTAMDNLDAKYIYVFDNGEVPDADAMNETLWWEVHVPTEPVPLAKLVNELKALEMELPYNAKELVEIQSALEPKTEQTEESPDKNRLSIKLTADQYEVIMQAINHVKEDLECEDAYALEMICSDYLSGV